MIQHAAGQDAWIHLGTWNPRMHINMCVCVIWIYTDQQISLMGITNHDFLGSHDVCTWYASFWRLLCIMGKFKVRLRWHGFPPFWKRSCPYVCAFTVVVYIALHVILILGLRELMYFIRIKRFIQIPWLQGMDFNGAVAPRFGACLCNFLQGLFIFSDQLVFQW